ncbi:MAG: DUF4465 domain-containing protein [Verrucomicrobia bacterium]|nr:DUF4465 domain-containing protein [Verrucomicrobiota bacterium]MCH8526598.1 DUF4465 domain-containing protein [Kiritimatiellia bacterium]
MKTHACVIALLAAFSLQASQITLEDLSFASGNHENGEHLTGTETITNDPWGPGSGSIVTKNSTFTSGSGGTIGIFQNTYNRAYDQPDGEGSFQYDFWSGWAYSRVTDNSTGGLANQYSAKPGAGQGGSQTYGIAGGPVSVSFTAHQNFNGRGLFVANTSYAYFSMLDGDPFSKQFTGGDEDWFLLTIEGLNNTASTGTVNFYLADFRSEDVSEHYILDNWSFIDLSPLGTVDTLAFTLTSSDTGSFGMNTPNFFAIDNIGAIPEPGTLLLLLGGAGVLFSLLRKNRT